MFKATSALAVLMLSALGGQPAEVEPVHELKKAKLWIEYSPAADVATLVVEGESDEALGRVEIRNPAGASIFRLAAESSQRLALSGFVVEASETSLAALHAIYAEGRYDMRARTLAGELLAGEAVLSHALPPIPVVIYPLEGDTAVPTTNLTVSWVADNAAAGYRVVLEQGENDGMAIELPPGSSSLRVPDGLLAPGTETHVDVAAIGASGNHCMAEVSFTTR